MTREGETNEQTLRRHMLADIRTYKHAEEMLRINEPGSDAWDVAWWARRHLEERIQNNMGYLGGLMGEL